MAPIIFLPNRVDFRTGNEQFFSRSRKSKDCAEAYLEYVAQAILQIDAEVVEKGRFRIGNYLNLACTAFA